MRYVISACLAAALSAAPAVAEDDATAPLMVSRASEAPQFVLPANTQVSLSLNDTITTKGDSLNAGDTFGLTVTHDVMKDGYVVIPAGARATGRVTWMTDKGAFGKSGKMDVAIEYVEVSGRRIPLEGTYRQEGEGNTVATVGGVIAVGLFAGFITGKSATIPQGRELVARTRADVPIQVARARAAPAAAPMATAYADRAEAERPPAPAGAGRPRRNWGLEEVRNNR